MASPSLTWFPTLRAARESERPSLRYDVHPTLPGRCADCRQPVTWAFGAWWDSETERHECPPGAVDEWECFRCRGPHPLQRCPEPNIRSRDVPHIIGRSGPFPSVYVVMDEHGEPCYITSADGTERPIGEVR